MSTLTHSFITRWLRHSYRVRTCCLSLVMLSLFSSVHSRSHFHSSAFICISICSEVGQKQTINHLIYWPFDNIFSFQNVNFTQFIQFTLSMSITMDENVWKTSEKLNFCVVSFLWWSQGAKLWSYQQEHVTEVDRAKVRHRVDRWSN